MTQELGYHESYGGFKNEGTSVLQVGDINKILVNN